MQTSKQEYDDWIHIPGRLESFKSPRTQSSKEIVPSVVLLGRYGKKCDDRRTYRPSSSVIAPARIVRIGKKR